MPEALINMNREEIRYVEKVLEDRVSFLIRTIPNVNKHQKLASYKFELMVLSGMLGKFDGGKRAIESLTPSVLDTETVAKLQEIAADYEEVEEPKLGSRQRREFIRAAVHGHGVLEDLSATCCLNLVNQELAKLPDQSRGQKSYRLTEKGKAVAERMYKNDMALAEREMQRKVLNGNG